MKIHDVKQGTGPWLALRAGIPTASELDNIITPLFKARQGGQPEKYLYRKLTEKAMGMPLESGFASTMEIGAILEHEAVPWYEFNRGVDVQRIGFCTTDDGRFGCSPDGLIGEDGGIEVKCPEPHTHLKYLLEGKLPDDYIAQVHGSLYCTGRKWWDFLSYSRQFPAFVIRVKRDEAVMAKIGLALAAWLQDFDAAMKRIDEMRAAEYAAVPNGRG